MPFIIGRKLEMTQLFAEDGTVTPVTLVRATPNVVAQVSQDEGAGTVSVQLGTDVKAGLNKPESGHLKDLPQCATLREFSAKETELSRGDTIEVGAFEPGMQVDVTGWSKGRGYAGVMKRHGFKGQPATHGQKDQKRMPGSIGSQEQAPTAKGKRMAGRMGGARVTVKNLQVVSVDPKEHVLAIKGAIPGARGGLLLISSREGKRVWHR